MAGERVCAIVGPTASGKSGAAIDVARALGAEIVSVDSMQIYTGMDVGTDKPDAAMRGAVPHHLLDVRAPDEVVTVKEFQTLARSAIAAISQRGRLPLLVGGSGLYWRAVVDDLDFPPHSPEVRASLERAAGRGGPEELHARLAELDPQAAARMEPGNTRRIVRALEVIELTGHRFSEQGAWDLYASRYDLVVAGLHRPRAELYERIAARVDRMLERGLLEEVATLEAQGLGATARQALGYRQVIEAEPGTALEVLRDRIVQATKRFARRQESWFAADPRITWFEAGAPAVAARLEQYFVAAFTARGGVP